MPIENATVISELNPDWPVGASDFVSQGDDQLRMMKKVLQNTLPNATAPITGTPTEINNITNAISWIDNGGDSQSYWSFGDPNNPAEWQCLAVQTTSIAELNKNPGLAISYLAIQNIVFPVGSQYTSYTDSRNPYDILGFGTWEPIVGLIAGVGSATDCQGYAQNYSAGYQPGFWRVQNFHVVHTEYDVSLTMDAVPPHVHPEATINSFYNDSGHTATVPGDGAGSTGSAGGHTPTGTGHLTIGEGTPTDSTAFFNPYYGAYIWKRTV
ncbi:hypothetical protein FRN05_13455 [Salmonella enterica subsp. enterica]|nr:hypothetical protein [Salmonella enterica subsp. enterica serovar Meleagridis]